MGDRGLGVGTGWPFLNPAGTPTIPGASQLRRARSAMATIEAAPTRPRSDRARARFLARAEESSARCRKSGVSSGAGTPSLRRSGRKPWDQREVLRSTSIVPPCVWDRRLWPVRSLRSGCIQSRGAGSRQRPISGPGPAGRLREMGHARLRFGVMATEDPRDAVLTQANFQLGCRRAFFYATAASTTSPAAPYSMKIRSSADTHRMSRSPPCR